MEGVWISPGFVIAYVNVTGETAPRVWETSSADSAPSAVCDELSVVLEDYKGTQKDICKEASELINFKTLLYILSLSLIM